MGKHSKPKKEYPQHSRPEVEAARIDADVALTKAQSLAEEQQARDAAHGPKSEDIKRGWLARKLLGDD